MINLETITTPPRETGVVYTKSWMVELVLDLAGYVPERRLCGVSSRNETFSTQVTHQQLLH